MAEDQDKQEEKFDFTAQGEAVGYISLDQARVLAMRTARETPGNYGRRFRNSPMAFEVVEDEDTEDHYVITLSFRPQGQFSGTPGQEQFFIEKEGAIAHRQVLGLPLPAGGRRFPLVPAIIGLVAVGAVLVVAGIVVAGRGFSGGTSADDAPAAVTPPNTPVQSPTAAPAAPTAVPVAMVPSTATAVPTPPPTPAPAATATPTPDALAIPTTGPALALPTPAPGTLPLLVFQNGLPIALLGIEEYTGVQDTYIAQREPSTNFERETSIFAKADPVESTYGLASLIRFDLSALPKNTEISRATLGLYRHPNAFAASATILVWELSATVALNTVTQNNWDRSIFGPQVGSFQVESLPEYGGSWHEVDLTEVVRNWVGDPASKHGLFLEQKSGAGLGPEVAFFSADYTSDGTPQGKALTPKLTVRYGPMAPAATPIPTPTAFPTPTSTPVPTSTTRPTPTRRAPPTTEPTPTPVPTAMPSPAPRSSPTDTQISDPYVNLGSVAEQARAFAEPILASTSRRAPDFEDDFSTGTGAWRARATGLDTQGTMMIQDGVMAISGLVGQMSVLGGPWSSSKDFVFEIDTRLVEGDFSSVLKFFFHQGGGYYFNIHLISRGTSWRLIKGTGAGSGVVPSRGNGGSPIGETTHYKAVVRGDQAVIYLNGTAILYLKDSDLDSSGQITLGCQSSAIATCEFDNLRFWNLANVP